MVDTCTLDNFNRANANPATGWTGIVNALQILSNLGAMTAANSAAYYQYEVYHADCEHFVQITTKPPDGQSATIFARGREVGSSATFDGYQAQLSAVAGTDTVAIQVFTNGVPTTLGASINQEFSAGDWLKIRCVGTTISAWHSTDGVSWTELGNRTDSTYANGGFGGLGSSSTTTRFDNFGGGSLNYANRAAGASTNGTSLSGGVALTMPVSIIPGELLLAFCTNDNPGATNMAISGWTEVSQGASGGSDVKHAIFAKIAAGSDTATLTGASQDYAASVIRITNHRVNSIANDIKKGTAATGSSETPDPPSLDAGASAKWLWIASAGIDDDDNTATYWPTNYTGWGQVESAQSTSSCMTDVAGRYTETQTENPGTFAILAGSGAEGWYAQTLAIPAAPFTLSPDLIDQTPQVFSPQLNLKVEPGFIDQTPSVFSPQLNLTVNPGFIDQTPTVYDPTVTVQGGGGQTVEPGFIDQTPTVYAPQLNLKVEPGFIDQSPTVFAPQVNLTVNPGFVDQSPTVFAPTITTGSVTLSPGLIDQTPTVYAPQVNLTVNPDFIDQTPQVFSPTVQPGAVIISLGFIDQTPTVYNPSVSVGGGGQQTVEPGLIDQSPSVYAPVITTGGVTVSPGLIDQSPTVFAPTVTPGSVTIALGFIDQTPQVFGPALALTILPGFIDQTPLVFNPAISVGPVTVTPGFIDQTPQVFAPTLSGGHLPVGIVRATATARRPGGSAIAKRPGGRATAKRPGGKAENG